MAAVLEALTARLRGVSALTTLALFVIPVPSLVSAQTAPEPALKAAFLLNFVRFTQWPAGSLGDPASTDSMILCVADDDVAGALASTVRGQRVANRTLAVRAIRPGDGMRNCALVYIGRGHARRVKPMLARLDGRSVLTVSDADRFLADGGMIRLYRDDGRIRFEVDLEAARRSNLRLSSRLLQLARTPDR